MIQFYEIYHEDGRFGLVSLDGVQWFSDDGDTVTVMWMKESQSLVSPGDTVMRYPGCRLLWKHFNDKLDRIIIYHKSRELEFSGL